MSNFTIIKNGSVIIEAESINWVSNVKEGTQIRKFETAPSIGYYLVADFIVPTIHEIDLNNINKELLKSTWTHMTGSIVSIQETSREVIKFTTDDGEYEVRINNVNNTPKPRTSPVSAQ